MFILAVFAVLFFVVDPGIGQTDADQVLVPSKVRWGEAANGAQLGISVAVPTFVVSEPVWVTVTFRNTGKAPITYVETSPLQEYCLVVTDEKGKGVPLTRYGKRIADNFGEITRTMMRSLDSGAEIQVRLPLNRVFDLSETGTYTITATRSVMLDSGFVDLHSAPVQIEVIEYPPQDQHVLPREKAGPEPTVP
jgi:hypothetical protein